MKNKLLIHACCAPCLVGVYQNIQESLDEFKINSMEDADVIWYNINIHPKYEYDRRKNTLINYLSTLNKVPIIIDEYNLMEFAKVAISPNDYGYNLRCEYCYRTRIKKIFEYAKKHNYTEITTTLLISPYQKHNLIIDICREYEKIYNIKFAYKDFRKDFRKGQQNAKELGLYRQKYCGCIFSIDEGSVK